jgi:hypothetical protein
MKMWILLGVLIAMDVFGTVRLVRQGWSAGDVLKLALWGVGGCVVVCVILVALQFV